MGLSYITEAGVIKLLESEAAKAKEKGISHIYDTSGFTRHLIGVGNNGFRIAKEICKRHPSLSSHIDPNVERVAGYMHDIGKVLIGDPYHEVRSAYGIITNGERDGLIKGGTPEQRKVFLMRVADCLSADAAMLEGMGSNFPNTALWPAYVTPELEHQVNFLRDNFGNSFAVPDTLERAIAMYADISDLKGEPVSVIERMEEAVVRYDKFAQKTKDGPQKEYWESMRDLSRPDSGMGIRIRATCGLVDQLLGKGGC